MLLLSTKLTKIYGNGKIDRTPSPAGLRKIKRISFDAFLRLKELVNGIKVYNSITPKGNRKNLLLNYKEPVAAIKQCTHEYEPSSIINTRYSLLWQWRRVNEWYKYINDPYENIKGHMITRIC